MYVSDIIDDAFKDLLGNCIVVGWRWLQKEDRGFREWASRKDSKEKAVSVLGQIQTPNYGCIESNEKAKKVWIKCCTDAESESNQIKVVQIIKCIYKHCFHW